MNDTGARTISCPKCGKPLSGQSADADEIHCDSCNETFRNYVIGSDGKKYAIDDPNIPG